MKKFFHASPRRLRRGKVLTEVFMTVSLVPHYTILNEAVAGNW